MRTTFWQLPIGARFEFRGRRYEKLALSMARDEERCGNIFQYETEVFWDCKPGEQPLAARAPEPHWTSYLSPAPAPVDRSIDRRLLGAGRRSNHFTPALSDRAGLATCGVGVRQEDSWK
jgi:hypothetical protein